LTPPLFRSGGWGGGGGAAQAHREHIVQAKPMIISLTGITMSLCSG